MQLAGCHHFPTPTVAPAMRVRFFGILLLPPAPTCCPCFWGLGGAVGGGWGARVPMLFMQWGNGLSLSQCNKSRSWAAGTVSGHMTRRGGGCCVCIRGELDWLFCRTGETCCPHGAHYKEGSRTAGLPM